MTRHIIRISLLMLLGVVTSVAVAWGCAAWSLQTEQPVPQSRVPEVWPAHLEVAGWPEPHAVHRARRAGFGMSLIITTAEDRVPLPEATQAWHAASREATINALRKQGVHGRLMPPARTHENLDVQFTSAWFGFPGRALRWESVAGSNGPTAKKLVEAASDAIGWRSGIDITDLPWTDQSPRWLPLVLIYPGLLANTAIYGGAWFAMLFGPGMVIRWRRRRAGRCVKCGYDLRGLSPEAEVRDQKAEVSQSGCVCPECGAKR